MSDEWKDEGLRTTLVSEEEFAEFVSGRQHWLVVFGPSSVHGVDELDDYLAHYPTYPTVFLGQIAVTVIPKAEVSSRRLNGWLRRHGSERRLSAEKDLVGVISGAKGVAEAEMLLIYDTIRRLSQVR